MAAEPLAAAQGADALGVAVTVMSRTKDKAADAFALGADRLLVSTDAEAIKKAQSSVDLIIDTVPVKHDVNRYMPLLDVDGTLAPVEQIGPLGETNSVAMRQSRAHAAFSMARRTH